MAQFLRTVRRGRWFRHPEIMGLAPGEIQADALGDIATTDNRLSVYKVTDPSEITRIATALASTRVFLSNFDYLLFDESFLVPLEIAALQNRGATPDAEVNDLHYNLDIHSGNILLSFAESIADGQVTRIRQQNVKINLQEARSRGALDESQIAEKLLEALT